MSKKCTNCGTELKEKAKFCSVCGTAVPEEINEVLKPKIAGKKIAMAVVAGAVLVGGGFAVYGKNRCEIISTERTCESRKFNEKE